MDRPALIASFLEVAVHETPQTAVQFLEAANWNLREAINNFLLSNNPSAESLNRARKRGRIYILLIIVCAILLAQYAPARDIDDVTEIVHENLMDPESIKREISMYLARTYGNALFQFLMGLFGPFF